MKPNDKISKQKSRIVLVEEKIEANDTLLPLYKEDLKNILEETNKKIKLLPQPKENVLLKDKFGNVISKEESAIIKNKSKDIYNMTFKDIISQEIGTIFKVKDSPIGKQSMIHLFIILIS